MKTNQQFYQSETDYLILLSLAIAPKHGHGIIRELERISAGREVMATGTLYSSLRRMLDDGWIDCIEDTIRDKKGAKRKLYKLTSLGKHILENDMDRLQSLVCLTTLLGSEK